MHWRALALAAFFVLPASAHAAPGDLVYQDCISSNTNQTTCSQLPVSNAGGANTALNSLADGAESPDGAQIYALSDNSDAISWLTRDPATGTLSFGGCLSASTATTSCQTMPGATGDGSVSGMGGPVSIAVAPDGRHVFVASNDDDALVRLSRNASSGALTFEGCTSSNTDLQAKCTMIFGANAGGANTALNALDDVVVSPDNANVYVASSASDALSRFGRNSTTGVFTGFQDCITPDTNVSATGSCAQLGGASAGGQGHRMNALITLAAARDGKSIVGASRTATVTDFPRGPGGAVSVGTCVTSNTETSGCSWTSTFSAGGINTVLDEPSDITVSPNNENVYVSASRGDALSVFGRNVTSGALENFEGCRTSNTNTTGCAFDPGSIPGGTTHLTSATGVAVSPDNSKLYAVAEFGDALTRNDRRASDGAFFFNNCISSATEMATCTRITPNASSGENTPLNFLQAVIASADGKDVYVISGSDAVSRLTIEGARPPVTPPTEQPPGGQPPGASAPSNDLTIGRAAKNKKKGTAKLTVTVPGPGEVGLDGNGVAARSATAAAAGELTLKLKTDDNKLKKLRRKGKVKVTPEVTFTPTGGTPNTETTKVKLVDR